MQLKKLVPIELRILLRKNIRKLGVVFDRFVLKFKLQSISDSNSLIWTLSNNKGEYGGSNSTSLGFDYLAQNVLKTFIDEGKILNVLEFGSAGEGFLSTLFFDWHVQHAGGGKVITVDISSKPYKQYKKLTRKTQFVVDDALNFIQSYQGDRFDLIYYDSLSISFETPQQSMTHHLELYEKSKHLLNREGFLVFDDTPLSLDFAMSNTDKQLLMEFEKKYGFLPGKGALVLLKADAINMKKVFHAYALILTQS